MLSHPLQVLKSGLTKLKNNVKTRKDDLLTRLHNKETLSAVDEEWLDNEANHVEEEALVDLLENASDYEHGLARLNSQKKTLVEKQKELGGGIKTALVVGKKRKHMFSPPHKCLS
jgi:hypothetical protein